MLKNFKKYIPLHLLILVYAIAALFSKCASLQGFLSTKYIVFYGLSIMLLGIYAVLWQQVLKRISLSVAFANKGIVLIWGMIFGAVFFSEHIKWNMILGALFVFIGILMVVNSDE